MSDEAGCRLYLYRLRGDQDGFYFNDNKKLESTVKIQQGIVNEIETQCRQRKIDALNLGKLYVPSDDPISDRQWLAAIARLDVLQEEVTLLEDRLKKFEEEKEQERERRLKKRLRHPAGGGKLGPDGRLCEIDGQAVTFIDGVPTINDPKSPFNGMEVARYRETVVAPYHNSRVTDLDERVKAYRSL